MKQKLGILPKMLLAACLAFVFLLIAISSAFTQTTAYAGGSTGSDGGGSDAGDGGGGNDPGDDPGLPPQYQLSYDTLYYFGNKAYNSACAKALDNFFLEYGDTSAQNLTYIVAFPKLIGPDQSGVLLPSDPPNTFIQDIIDYYDNGLFSMIEDAYVIFDMECAFVAENPDEGTIFTDYLNEIFYMLKQQNCRIMFVNATDEFRLLNPAVDFYHTDNYNAFLDYVDIHINTDMFYTFVDNVLLKIEQACESVMIHDFTMLVDQSLTGNMVMTDDGAVPTGWFFTEYLLPYLVGLYFEELEANDIPLDNYGAVLNYFAQADKFQIICHLGGRDYYELGVGPFQSEDNYCFSEFHNKIKYETIIPVGDASTVRKAFDTGYWLEGILDIRDYLLHDLTEDGDLSGNAFLSYIYTYESEIFDLHKFSESPWDSLFDDSVKTTGDVERYIKEDLEYILFGYIFGDESLWMFYDNWFGRCLVTHKPMRFGPGGWMTCTNSIVPGWLLYDPADTKLFFEAYGMAHHTLGGMYVGGDGSTESCV